MTVASTDDAVSHKEVGGGSAAKEESSSHTPPKPRGASPGLPGVSLLEVGIICLHYFFKEKSFVPIPSPQKTQPCGVF